MRLVLVGPPGAGKGTQAEFIADRFSIPKISTGDIFRANVSGGTELGKLAKQYMDAGDLVPDQVTIAMVRDRLSEPDAAAGFLLDGFPRNVAQAYELDSLLGDLRNSLDVVLELVVDHDEIVKRLSGRRTCRKCGHIWHVEYDPTKEKGVCDRCGGELFQRDDDMADTVRHRLDVYAEQTAPLIQFYDGRGQLVVVDAMGTVEDVTERAISALVQASETADQS
jgi:adenylate kinase